MTSSVLTLIPYRFLCTALELIPNYDTSRRRKIKNDDKCLSAPYSTRVTMLWADMLNFYDCISTFCLFQWEFKEERIQNAHQISVTHITHILTQIRVQGGWCESDRRKLQERSAWANDRGSLHDITPDTFDRSFNVTMQPLTPTTDVTGKPGHACCTWTHVSVCMCAFCISTSTSKCQTVEK